MPRIEQLRGFALAVIARPGIVDIVPDGDAARRLCIPEGRGRLLVNRDRQQFLPAERLAQRFDEFGIGGRIHGRHPLLAVSGAAIPQVDAVDTELFDRGFHLRYEIDDLSVGQVAESEPFPAAFDRDADLAAVLLQRTDVFHGMVEDIAHVVSEVQQRTAGSRIVIEHHGAQVDDVAYGIVPGHGRSAGQFLPHDVVLRQQRLKIVRVDVEHEEQVMAVVQRIAVRVRIGLANRDVVVKRLVRVRSILPGDRKRQHVFSGSEPRRREFDAFQRRALRFGREVEGFAVGEFVIRLGKQDPFDLVGSVVIVEQGCVDPCVERKTVGGRFCLLEIEIPHHEPAAAFGQQHVYRLFRRITAAQHPGYGFQRFLIGEFSAFPFHGIGFAGRKAREYRRTKKRHHPCLQIKNRLHNHSLFSLSFGISMP